MRYIDYLKTFAKFYGIMIVSASSTYGILCFFGCAKQIVATPEQTIGVIVGALIYIFVGALLQQYYDSLKK